MTWIARHWRGELPLAISYWINGALLNVAMLLGVGLLLRALPPSGNLVLLFVEIAGIWAMTVAVSVWQFVGTWRAASRPTAATGRRLWPTVAKVALLLGALGLGRTLVQDAAPQIADSWAAVTGDRAYGPRGVRVLAGGAEIEVSGPLARGMADEFRAALARAPQARLVHLDSPGGRVGVALEIADLVVDRAMDTLVDRRCLSACTLVLVAGRQRLARPRAAIGFHAGRFGHAETASVSAAMRAAYEMAGLPPGFIARALGTPAADMWYPTQAEMLQAGVLTGIAADDAFAMAGFGPAPTEAAALAALESLPLYRALAAAEPEGWPALREAWVRGALEGRPAAEFQALARRQVTEAAARLRPRLPDAAALELGALLLDETRALHARDPAACGAYLLHGDPAGWNKLPPALQQRDAAMTVRILAEATASPAAPPSPEAGGALMARALDGMRRGGNNPDRVRAALGPGVPAEGVCPAFAALVEAALALPPPDAAALLRHMLRRG